jgi:hypothetical protein
MAKTASPGASAAGAGISLSLFLSLVVLGLSASAVAQDHQSKIAIAHLVVVRLFSITYACVPLQLIRMLI